MLVQILSGASNGVLKAWQLLYPNLIATYTEEGYQGVLARSRALLCHAKMQLRCEEPSAIML